jgi:hypothetical protein
VPQPPITDERCFSPDLTSMADKHNARMFRWRKQLCADPSLTDFDFRVAYALAEWTLSHTGCARVKQATLASDVGGTSRGVQKSLRRIAGRGHLRIEDNSKRGEANAYWPIIRNEVSEDDIDVEGTNHRSYPPELPFAGGREPPFVGGTNRGSEGVRTRVRTEDPYEHPESFLKETPSAADMENAFEEWWSLYPKRVSKGAARKVFERIIKKKLAPVEELKRGAMRYAASVADPKYVKHPATWLNGECWLDEPDKPAAATDAQPSTVSAGNGYAKLLRGSDDQRISTCHRRRAVA